MKNEVNPVVVIVVLAVVVIGVVIFLWTQTQGKTFTKSEAHGIQFDPSKARQTGGNP